MGGFRCNVLLLLANDGLKSLSDRIKYAFARVFYAFGLGCFDLSNLSFINSPKVKQKNDEECEMSGTIFGFYFHYCDFYGIDFIR